MRAAYIEQYGGPEVLVLGDRPKPTPSRGEVLVKVHAASVNPRDWLLREGKYPFKKALGPFPIILGSDFSGVVASVHPSVTLFKPGDSVFGMQSKMGAFAEWIAVPETLLAAKPPEVTHEEAAAIPCAGLTAYQALVGIGGLPEGGTVLINGASGGVGSYAIQIAKKIGAHVTAVASGANADLCSRLGAHAVLDYAGADFTKTIREQDIVFDAAGRSGFAASARVLKPSGHYITTVPSGAAVAAVTTSAVRTLGGLLPGKRAHVVLVRGRVEDLRTLAAWVREGQVRSVVGDKYDFADVAAALAKSKTWHTSGKLVLNLQSS
jgi:NADPH:quinone reductase-like Zn-dependent oxidoreductase